MHIVAAARLQLVDWYNAETEMRQLLGLNSLHDRWITATKVNITDGK